LEFGSIRAFYALCYGSSATVLAAALWLTSNPNSNVNAPILLFVFAALLLVIGIVAHQHFRTQTLAIEAETEKERELEVLLDEQKEAIDTLADGLDVGILICSLRAEVLYSNKSAESIFRVENPIGKTILATTISYDLEQLVLQAAQNDERCSLECTITYPEERSVLAEAWPDALGNRVFLSIYDFTSLRKLERIRQDFVANVSHEIRTPLASIRAMTETLLDDQSDTETTTRYYEQIIDEVDRLSLITQDLLILSAAESNPVRRQDCDLTEVVRSVVGQLGYKAEAKLLKLEIVSPAHVPFNGNHTQMVQVIINLVENAINYTLEGTVTIQLRDLDSEVVISVSDTGIGIPSDQADRIFERFYRIDKARSRVTGGTGLGLSIVKHIVEAHGGSVSVESVLGKGSSFTIRLPKFDSVEAAAALD
jgi:two-component system phosphate regulon sensor histidine kinase PhoR